MVDLFFYINSVVACNFDDDYILMCTLFEVLVTYVKLIITK